MLFSVVRYPIRPPVRHEFPPNEPPEPHAGRGADVVRSRWLVPTAVLSVTIRCAWACPFRSRRRARRCPGDAGPHNPDSGAPVAPRPPSRTPAPSSRRSAASRGRSAQPSTSRPPPPPSSSGTSVKRRRRCCGSGRRPAVHRLGMFQGRDGRCGRRSQLFHGCQRSSRARQDAPRSSLRRHMAVGDLALSREIDGGRTAADRRPGSGGNSG